MERKSQPLEKVHRQEEEEEDAEERGVGMIDRGREGKYRTRWTVGKVLTESVMLKNVIWNVNK